MLTRRQALAAPLLAALPTVAGAAAPFRVAYAGSMGALMDHGIGPAFAARAGVAYQGIGQGAFALARLIAAKQMRADVFIPITAGPFEVLREAGLARDAVPVASTQMCIAYSPKSRFAKDFAAAAAGHVPWYEVLLKPGVRFGRTDPRTDPQGRNILFAMRLAELYLPPARAGGTAARRRAEPEADLHRGLAARAAGRRADRCLVGLSQRGAFAAPAVHHPAGRDQPGRPYAGRSVVQPGADCRAGAARSRPRPFRRSRSSSTPWR